MESLSVLCNFVKPGSYEEWIKSVWDAEFITYEEPPDEYLEYIESDGRQLLRESHLILRTWIAANCEPNCEPSEFSWQNLMILNINVHGLLAMLGYIIKTGQRVDTDEASRQACLEATSLYFMLLAIPGSNAFRVYHSNLYQSAMETLKISGYIFSHRRKSSKETDTPGNSNVDDEWSDILSHSEKLKLVKRLNRIISDLITMLKIFRLKEHAVSLDITIRALLDITRLEAHVKFYNNNRIIDYGLSSLSQNAFAALQELCSNSHGNIDLTIMLIAQYMLPYLLFQHSNAQAKSITIAYEAAIYFLKDLLKVHEEETLQAIITLIHQLMVKCPERSEGRQRQAVVVIKLLSICSRNIILTVFKDIILFSHSGKIVYRLFAQEIIGKLLSESSLSNNNLHEDMRTKMRRILIAVVLSRCMDRSPLVRGKAIATLALFSDCIDNVDKTILKNIFNDSVSNKSFPVIDDLKRALSANDNPLPGSNTLIDMLLDRVNDERALVRRSALKILRNITIMFPLLIDRMTHVISDCCRDPTVTVRQLAVHVLSEILQEFPHNSNVLDEWLQAVLPQIYDVESKVQEKVLECLESVLLNRITNVSMYVPDNANSLPWRVLSKLSNMRMRKHLSKACNLWVKNGVITKSVISNLQSHVSTENKISVWILLAALAENMKIPNISKCVMDYKEVIQKNDFHTSLVLHVLRHTWSTLNRECLEDLYQHLYKCLSRFEINFNLISICLDILNDVLRHLYADSGSNLVESNMVELMKLSEMEVQDILEDDEDRTQDTLKMRAIFTLGHASCFCTNRVSPSTLHILEKLLLQWESLPETVREIKNLPASAVVFLCQQALRDHEIAKEVTPIFGNLMRQETNSGSLVNTAVKINAAKALADICVRFTSLVEPYLPDMCISMKDSNPAVREAIVVIFSQLLLEDFIKMKGPFFFHILTMLSDVDKVIRELTLFLVEERLLVKNRTLISQQFLESIYHYNDYRSHNTFRGHRMHDREKKLLTLPGKANESKRNIIYEFMLEHLDPSAKFKLVVKLTSYVLNEVYDDGSIDVTTEEGACVLKDTLFVLGNNRLQVSSFVDKHKDDTQEIDESANHIQSSATTSNNATNIMIANLKKHNLENLLPTLIRLKIKLKSLTSPLGDNVERVLYKIYSEYEKEHLLSLLNEYPELEKEMDCYQRRLKDKNTSESDDSTNSCLSPTVNHYKDLLLDLNKRIPRILIRPLSPSTISSYKNSSSCSGNSRVSTPECTSSRNLPARTKSFSPTELSLRPSLSTSTSPCTHDVSPNCAYVLPVKRPSSELDFPVCSPRRKVLRSNVSR